MTKTDQLDVKLQAEVLTLGRVLSAGSPRHSGLARPVNPEAFASEVDRILRLVRASPFRKLFGIRQDFSGGDDAVRLKAIALVGWKMISESHGYIDVESVVTAITNSNGCNCEEVILARDHIGKMIGERLLFFAKNDAAPWSGKVLLPKQTFSWLAGGADSKGDFDPKKILPSSRTGIERTQDDYAYGKQSKVLTAKQLFEKVRREVVGLDPQVRVLASRFALHVARADALKAGLNAESLSQMVVCLVASSGASKSFLASRMSAASGLPYVQFDATTLTESGFVGSDIDDIYKMLTSAAGDAAAASRGVVFLDEFCKKSAHHSSSSRDVGGEAVQMELLAKLQATATPFLIGGKRAHDGRQFLFDGRPTGYILAGVFAGLDDAIDRLAGRKGIGFASEVGCRRHVCIQEALKDLGFLDELVNRIGLVLRLPDPTVEHIMRATVGGILDGFNEVLGTKGIVLLPTTAAVRAIGEYSMDTKAFYRGAKAVLATISADLLYDPHKGTVVIDAGDVRRAIDRLSSGLIQSDELPADGSRDATPDAELDAQPEAAVAGG